MPKIDKGPSHRHSVSTSSAAGGTRSSSWSTKDDETLIRARAQGLNWNQIGPKHFPSKTPNACRKRHERLMERQNAEQWDGVKLEILAQAYMDVRQEMWSLLAARVGEKWQLVETKCMEKGLKNLTQAARSAHKKLENGTYHDYEDSGIGISDLEEEQEDQHGGMSHMSAISEPHYSPYSGYPQPQHQRVPSIQSMLHPMQQHSHHMQQPVHQPMQQSMQQPMPQSIQQPMPQSIQQIPQPMQQSLQQPMPQSMSQPMQQPMHSQSMAYSSHQLSHPQ